MCTTPKCVRDIARLESIDADPCTTECLFDADTNVASCAPGNICYMLLIDKYNI